MKYEIQTYKFSIHKYYVVFVYWKNQRLSQLITLDMTEAQGFISLEKDATEIIYTEYNK